MLKKVTTLSSVTSILSQIRYSGDIKCYNQCRNLLCSCNISFKQRCSTCSCLFYNKSRVYIPTLQSTEKYKNYQEGSNDDLVSLTWSPLLFKAMKDIQVKDSLLGHLKLSSLDGKTGWNVQAIKLHMQFNLHVYAEASKTRKKVKFSQCLSL